MSSFANPQKGDSVEVRGVIISLLGGIAIVELHRSYPPGVRIPIQVAGLRFIIPLESIVEVKEE